MAFQEAKEGSIVKNSLNISRLAPAVVIFAHGTILAPPTKAMGVQGKKPATPLLSTGRLDVGMRNLWEFEGAAFWADLQEGLITLLYRKLVVRATRAKARCQSPLHLRLDSRTAKVTRFYIA